MGSSSVEACCEAPEVFELVEAAFDAIAVLVEVGVVRDRDLARRDFPVAACWWARTNVLSSMRYSFLRSLVRTLNTRSQTPAFPFAISLRQLMPVRARAQHPQDTVDEETIVLGGAAGIAKLAREQAFDPPPLCVGQFVPLDHVSCSESSDPEHKESSP
jgi:hypothetical protein